MRWFEVMRRVTKIKAHIRNLKIKSDESKPDLDQTATICNSKHCLRDIY